MASQDLHNQLIILLQQLKEVRPPAERIVSMDSMVPLTSKEVEDILVRLSSITKMIHNTSIQKQLKKQITEIKHLALLDQQNQSHEADSLIASLG